MPQIYYMGPTALLPLRRKLCWGIFRPGLNLQTWVLKASTLPLGHQNTIVTYFIYLKSTFYTGIEIHSLRMTLTGPKPALIVKTLYCSTVHMLVFSWLMSVTVTFLKHPCYVYNLHNLHFSLFIHVLLWITSTMFSVLIVQTIHNKVCHSILYHIHKLHPSCCV